MKRLIVTLTIVFSFLSINSFADSIMVSAPVVKSFKSSFKNATDVNWSTAGNYYKVSFASNGQYVTAYYDANGKMLALTRNINSLQLPLTLQSDLKNEYESYWITDLFEVADEQGTTYYVTMENADSKIILKSSDSVWTTYQKQRKS